MKPTQMTALLMLVVMLFSSITASACATHCAMQNMQAGRHCHDMAQADGHASNRVGCHHHDNNQHEQSHHQSSHHQGQHDTHCGMLGCSGVTAVVSHMALMHAFDRLTNTLHSAFILTAISADKSPPLKPPPI